MFNPLSFDKTTIFHLLLLCCRFLFVSDFFLLFWTKRKVSTSFCKRSLNWFCWINKSCFLLFITSSLFLLFFSSAQITSLIVIYFFFCFVNHNFGRIQIFLCWKLHLYLVYYDCLCISSILLKQGYWSFLRTILSPVIMALITIIIIIYWVSQFYKLFSLLPWRRI